LTSEKITPFHQEIFALTQTTWLEGLVRENHFIKNPLRDILQAYHLQPVKINRIFEQVSQMQNKYEATYGNTPKRALLAANNDNALTTLAKTFLHKHSKTISQLFNHDEDSKICKMLCATFLSLNDDFTQENQHEAIAHGIMQRFINLALTPLQTETTLLETTAMEKDLEILYATMLAKLYPDEFSFEPDETAIAQSAPRENSFFSLQTETHPNPTNSQGIASENTHVKLG